ncbi:MAG: hypothetical protein JNK05_19950 [Myxococcales bacterium]|nr:hypothetical protein [Myxococcales bacterium]
MRRSLFALSLGLVIASTGCKSRPMSEQLKDKLMEQYEEDTSLAQQLCGYPVAGLTGTTITNVVNTGNNRSGSGTAMVTATPTPMPGMQAAGPCSGSISFIYGSQSNTTYRRTGSIGRRRTTSSTTTTMYVWGITVTNRTSQVPAGAGMGAPTGMPSMPGTPTGAPAGMLTIGGTAAGILQAGDTALQDGSVADDYQIMLTANVPVTIVVRGGPSLTEPGSNLDVYAALLMNGTEIEHNDDISPDNRNSRIVHTPTTTGMHTLRVTTFGSGLKSGPYNVQVFPGANPNAL